MGRNLTRDRNGNPYTGDGRALSLGSGLTFDHREATTSDYWPQSQDRGSYRVGDLSERMKGEPIKEGDPVAPGITWRKTTIV